MAPDLVQVDEEFSLPRGWMVDDWGYLVQLSSDEEDELAKQDPTLDHCGRGEDD